MEEKVVLVDAKDQELGLMEKLEAHKKGLLHRAFSVCLFNSKNEVLLHQRAMSKYHCPGLWTNACCSHPRQHEAVEDAAHRRLQEELRFDCPIKKAFSFIYKVDLANGLIEHEYDHVYVGTYNGSISGWNPDEVMNLRWEDPKFVDDDIVHHADAYTPWFIILWQKMRKGQ